jgi:formylglycine-generating enzyme required for sulfatase activity
MQTGTILRNRYRILQKLGSGGFGDTYLAEDGDLPGKPRCVVKHLKPQQSNAIVKAKELFEREAEALYKLGKKNDSIPELFAYFEEGGEFYLVQEYIEGEDLSKELTPGKQWGESEVRKLLVGVLEALEPAHRESVIHRDIKPLNLMRRKEDGKIVLIDFGAVKEICTLIVNAQTVGISTPGYSPTEQMVGQPKLSSDVYAVGMVGIQALTGVSPNELLDVGTMEVVWRDRVSVSKELGDVLDKMVRSSFSDRYANATLALKAIKATEESSATAPTTVQTPPATTATGQSFFSRRQVIVGGAALAITGGVAYLAMSEPTPEPKVTTTQTFTTVKVNSRGQIIERLPGEAEVLAEDLGSGVSLEMVSIPGGRFLMGSPENEEDRRDSESPQHYVKVPAFFLGKYPVTQGQYQAVMGNNPSRFKGANRPVETVSWNDATEFCQRLSQRTGKTYRLPSEAEWEYACRAGTTTPFYFGETITTELANYNGNYTYGSAPKGVYREETTNVGSFPPNAFGLYDMHGNVWEWCQDVLHSNYNGVPTDGSAWVSGGYSSLRMQRGGSWVNYPWYCRCAFRIMNFADGRNSLRGFRVVLLPGL